MRQDAAEQGEQILLLGRQHREVAADVEVGDSIRRLRIELDLGLLHGRVLDRDVLELHRDVAQLECRQECEVLLGVLVGFES